MKINWIYLPIFLLLLLTACQQAKRKSDANIELWRERASESQQKAMLFLQGRRADSAFAYFHKAKEHHMKAGDSMYAVYSLLNIADIYKQYNDYAELEVASTNAIRYLNNPRDTIYNPIIYTNLGICYRNLHNYKAALASYRRGLEFTKSPLNRAIIKNNIANVLIDSTAYASAKEILQAASVMPVLQKDSTTYARVLDNLGYANHKLGRAEGIAQMEQAAKIRQRQHDESGLVTSLMHLADSHAATDAERAVQYATQASILAGRMHSSDDQLEALSFIVRHSANALQVAQASRLHLTKLDSVLEVRQRAKNGFAAIKYESKSAHDKVAKLETERELQRLKWQKSALLAIIIFLLLFSGTIILVLWLRQKHRKDKFRAGYLVETRISKQVHDELANDVYGTIAFAETADLGNSNAKEKLLHTLDDIYARTRDISHQNSPIFTNEHFEEQLRQMLSGYNSNDSRIIIQGIGDVPWQNIAEAQKMSTYRALHELMVNMRKHSNASHVGIRFEYDGKNLKIMYSDNGIGMPAEGNIFKNGLSNVENRIIAVGGTITFEPGPDKGLKVIILYKAKR